MAKHRRRTSQSRSPQRRNQEERHQIAVEYHSRPFLLLHKELADTGYVLPSPHPIRSRFWQFVLEGTYSYEEALPLVKSFVSTIEKRMAEAIGNASLTYWLHVYRRLFPGPIARDTRANTIALTRSVLEAAFQKYGRTAICHRIAPSSQISENKILGGLLAAPEFQDEARILRERDQLVLADFTSSELRELYDLESLAYEIQRSTGIIRSIGKGGRLVVGGHDIFQAYLDDELTFLTQHFDSRSDESEVSSPGILYEQTAAPGTIFLPNYNPAVVTSEELRPWFRRFGIEMSSTLWENPNFFWAPMNIRSYRSGHRAFAEAFMNEYGVSLDAVLCVITAICTSWFRSWCEDAVNTLWRDWQRAYRGPTRRSFLMEDIRQSLPQAVEILALDDARTIEMELDRAVDFWRLTDDRRSDIGLEYPGPHYPLIPFGNDKLCWDLAWVRRRLYHFFTGLTINSQCFKGRILEDVVGRTSSVLPTRACRALDGQQKEIDCAYAVGKHLVIVECKVVSRSIAYARGDRAAVEFRRNRVVERGLAEADDKARWLAERPRGSNYDVSHFTDILPVAVSPFADFMPSWAWKFWVTDTIPRVLTPTELGELLADSLSLDKAYNRVRITAKG